MAKVEQRQCPGDPAPISIAICRGRQLRNYEKCADCDQRDEDISRKSVKAETAGVYEKVFKAYDVRGLYPGEINEQMSEQIGGAIARFLNAKTMVVSRDMRLSGEKLSRALIQGILTAGSDVIDCGLLSTDANYFAIATLEASGGVQVTASHNPAEYNGFKVSRESAIPMGSDSGLDNVKRIALGPPLRPSRDRGRLEKADILPRYASHVLSFIRNPASFKVAIDAGNGMAGKMLPPILAKLPLEVVPLYFELDGSFPNHEANPLKPENMEALQAAVRAKGCDFGVAFDGDADRCMFTDETGRIIPSDLMTALLASRLLERSKGAAVCYDLRSSRVVAEEIRKHGGVPVIERVGHAFMKATMRRRNAVFGGELSGHYYFRDNFFADSGAIAFMELINVLSAARRPLSELLQPLRRYFATGEINFEVENKDEKMRRLADVFKDGKVSKLDGVTVEYDDWWFNVRASNTEPKLRLNLEAANQELMEQSKKRVMDVILE